MRVSCAGEDDDQPGLSATAVSSKLSPPSFLLHFHLLAFFLAYLNLVGFSWTRWIHSDGITGNSLNSRRSRSSQLYHRKHIMSSTSTTQSRLRDKRNAVPLLLSAFPVPPSHIPASPFTPLSVSPSINPPSSPFIPPIPSPALNPPPSLPPSTPLPPVPGPSPVTEQETLMFISAARSRRVSKLSLASTSSYSRRDSTATIASIVSGSNSLPSLSPSTTPLDSSARSLRSFPSSTSLSVSITARFGDKSPMMEPRICEEDQADLTRLSLDEISYTSPMPSDEEKVVELGILPSLSRQDRSGSRKMASAFDIREPPASPEAGRLVPTTTNSLPAFQSLLSRSHSLPESKQYAAFPVEKDLPPLPCTPSNTPLDPSCSRRTGSPDIRDILASTPRPRKSSSASTPSRSASSSASRSRRSTRTSLRRHVSEGVRRVTVDAFASASGRTSPSSRRTSGTSVVHQGFRPSSPTELAYMKNPIGADEHWDHDSYVSDYGVPVDQTGTPIEIFDEEEEQRLDRELDGSDSDSSLDLHTPLPNLMLRDGLLSPNSKLLAVASDLSSPFLSNGRPGSVFSVASTAGSIMTKSGVFKDGRDTPKRRVRHRDGRLLRGGIGLTTGLGWSDSEDEDAPSPLTRQLCSRSLSQKSSSSSLHGSKSLASLPPTSRKNGTGPDRRTSTSSTISSISSAMGGLSRTQSRASASSMRSASSGRRAYEAITNAPLRYIQEGEEFGMDTPSTSSTASLPMPITPIGLEEDGRGGNAATDFEGPLKFPPKPDARSHEDAESLLHWPSSTSLPASARSSVTSSLSAPTRTSVPRPLRLPQSQYSLRYAQEAASRPPLPSSVGSNARIPRMRTSSEAPHRTQESKVSVASALVKAHSDSVAFPSNPRPPSIPSTVSRSPSGGSGAGSKLKPRTGTGMTYRTSSTPAARPSMMRMPSSSVLRAASKFDMGDAP
ncbi:hypothetical protein A0H81_13704 [Grifola frondosa]|uniref:Uncharacterized protein n=1 Tax=Grifola frondosa TaxID=5627 RepID=A0A1C7LQV4_GRIFR|nr:hypothetical protein A0H81_13704 [Grifola frondosa]